MDSAAELRDQFPCPAAYYDSNCPGCKECERLALKKAGKFGRTVRVPLDLDRRIFTPAARHTAKWKKGMDKLETRVTLALVVLLAMALGRIKANQAELMRSQTAPVRRTG